MCLQRDDPTTSGPCLPGATLGTNPGASSAGGWMTSAYPPGVLAPGAYHFVGQAVGAGAGSSGHADIVISLRH
jgi:hypothetical protein